MLGLSWLYDAILTIYALSVLAYFSDFLQRNRKANRFAFGLLSAVWTLMTFFFLGRAWEKQYLPLVTLFDTLFFFSWMLVSLSLVLNWFYRVDLFVFFANVVGFAFLAFSLFAPQETTPEGLEHLRSNLLWLHISMAFFSYVAFFLSAIFSAMYLWHDRMLKRKDWHPRLWRFPSLEALDRFAFRLVAIGVPLLLLGLILGAIWAYWKISGNFWLDPKVLASLAVLAMYVAYLVRRLRHQWPAKRLAEWNLIAFVAVLVNLLVSAAFSSFHLWL